MDAEPIYRQLGLYVILFQELEGRIANFANWMTDPSNSGRGRAVLTGMSFRQLLTSTEVLFAHNLRLISPSNSDEHKSNFHELMGRCLRAAEQRNTLVHSTYIHLEAGGELQEIIRSKFRLKTSGVDGGRHEIDREVITPESFDPLMREVAELVAAIGQYHLQLIHWIRPGTDSERKSET
jgi:hypothetical protein